jgi:hypothetical protein
MSLSKKHRTVAIQKSLTPSRPIFVSEDAINFNRITEVSNGREYASL